MRAFDMSSKLDEAVRMGRDGFRIIEPNVGTHMRFGFNAPYGIIHDIINMRGTGGYSIFSSCFCQTS
jgi:hypothetical protein